MTPYCTITPTRGDRNKLLAFTLSRIPCYQLVMLEEPKSEAIDIVPRIRHGIERAKAKGYEYVIIMEDDDFYPRDYVTSIDWTDIDFFGYSDTVYYNLKNRTYQTFDHPNRSSLFCTGLRIDALEGFDWPNDNWPFLDIRLWEFANRTNKRIKLLQNNPALGIKGHGLGKHAGKGHVMLLKYSDNDFSYLKSRVDEEAFKFYSEIIK